MADARGLAGRRRLRRVRVIAADKAYPGGLSAHVNPPDLPAPSPVTRPEGGALIGHLADRTLPPRPYALPSGPIQAELGTAITDAELDELDALLTDEERRVCGLARSPGADGVAGRVWAVALALHHGVGAVAERTGLSSATPPDAVHAMARVTWTTGGDPRYADVVLAAFAEAGSPLEAGMSVLDFGCSSGRIVRMLAARRPALTWHGCDVNTPAIEWARSALPAIAFHDQPLRPPMAAFADGALDAAFAISIWSHYDRGPALAWLDEIHRILRPGGALLFTTHGYGAVAQRSSDPDHGQAGQEPLMEPLYRDGYAFVPFEHDEGDGGVVDEEWGHSFVTPEWIATHVTPRWSIRLYRPRAIEYHQDLYVLRREP